jgi:hypothetical protein
VRVERWSAARARTAIASPDLARTLGPAVGVAAVIVDLDDGDGNVGEVVAALTRLPVIAIATGSVDTTEPWDVVVTDPEPVVEGVLAAPLAAVTAAQVLRGAVTRSVDDGLLVESLAYASLQAGPEFTSWLTTRGRRVRRAEDSPRVRVDDKGEHVDIVLTRPRLRNLLDAAMRDQLVDALQAVGAGADRPITLRAEGPAFCAGGDPAEFGTVADPATAHALRATANVAPWLYRVASRTTAVIDGPCVGAGVELAAFCGRVEATAKARFRLPETRMGLIPGAGGTVSIPRRIGAGRTLEWLLSDAEIDAATAHEWGLVDLVVTD